VEILVRKYGGSSLATLRQVREVAEATARAAAAGHPVVTVVSARGTATDDLISLASQLAEGCPESVTGSTAREVDQLLATGECASAAQLALALGRLGVCATSLTGAQAGIRVAGRHGAGKVATVDPGRLLELLDAGVVPVVCGFQGVNGLGDTVTLGRGGSDTTAVALAAGLGAPACEIYTDVRGVCTADPRLIASARVLPVVDIAVMAELAFAGAKVVHSRAVELAALRRIALRVSSSSPTGPGTVIKEGSDVALLENAGSVVAVTHDPNVAWAQLRCRPSGADLMAELFAALANLSIPADQVARSDDGHSSRIGFTVSRTDLAQALPVLDAVAAARGGVLDVRDDLAKVSVVGFGLLNRPELPARLAGALDTAGITVGWLSTSQSRMSVLVARQDQVRAVEVLHAAFALERAESPVPSLAQA
jgi:aspartate kinase